VIIHLRQAGVSVVVDLDDGRLPHLAHWGADLGELSDAALAALVRAGRPQAMFHPVDALVPLRVLPEQSTGWLGTPGLAGHRDGTAFSPAFQVTGVDRVGQRVGVTAADPVAELGLELELELTSAGLLRQRVTITNTGSDRPFTVDSVVLTMPVPPEAVELLDLTGRWSRERSPQRHPFSLGTWSRESRHGRTGFDSPLVLVAGTGGFGFRSGEVWGVHVAWSGNHRSLAERNPNGTAMLAGGELLLPGEVRLAPGAAYRSPWLYGSFGRGLDELAGRFHTHLRSRPAHPRSPRPVVLNTWEAVYFNHDLATLTRLADTAAEVGVERFVLDDGWFRHRRDDTAGLGDWYVDETVWPQGLGPLIDHVRGLGLGFGLWVEPEMVNPDSDLARAHPDWILAVPGRLPPPARNQQVLDLANPAAYDYVLGRLSSLLSEYPIEYLKWDHNRDLVEAGHGPTGEAGVHGQTLAVYRLLDELRARHPGVEIESCSSGGARIDLEILERTDRVWASDCIDPLERQQIQRWTALLLPPELVGSHVGAPTSHTTGRTHALGFRAGTALFGHVGIEWDLTRAGADERACLAEWVRLYRDLRPLLHTGTLVHGDHPDPALWVHGVVAADATRAVYALVAIATGVCAPPGRVRLPGLAPEATYRLAPLPPGDVIDGPRHAPLPWWADGVELTGRVLATVGVQAPVLHPERLVLLEAVRIGG
jgi:alpha-galactosidase